VRAFQDEKLCQLLIWKLGKKFPNVLEALDKSMDDLWKGHVKYNDLLPMFADVRDLYRTNFIRKL
jgi:hypothetical protein